jgi:hypothetical protein
MRVAEARRTQAVVAARQGELEEATALGLAALQGPRKSLPHLLMVGGELDVELDRRFPNEAATDRARLTRAWRPGPGPRRLGPTSIHAARTAGLGPPRGRRRACQHCPVPAPRHRGASAVAGMINATTPLFTVIVAVLLRHEP